MEIKSYKVSAVIPVAQYANIQPSIELEGGTIAEMQGEAMSHIKTMFDMYGEKPLNVSEDVIATAKLFSFNEEGIAVDFDPNQHVYTFNGKLLESATKFIKPYTKEFNGAMISKNCEKSWGVPAVDIEKMWGSNAKLATDFGNVVHGALEHWLKFKDNGVTIMGNTDKEVNPALPKHPFLKSIIEDFEQICGVGEYIAEAFVTDINAMTCGQIDRLQIVDKAKKVCRIIDYKVNVGAEEITSGAKLSGPFKDLPANKLSKYQIQLNYYRKILEASGWTVQGMDVYVFEDTWKLFTMETLEI